MSRSGRRDEALDDALSVLSDLAGIAAVVADAVSIPALKPVVSTLSIVIKRVKDVRTNSEIEVVFFENTKTLGEVITGMVNEANTAPGGGSYVLQERLNRLAGALDEIQYTADGLKGGLGFRGSLKRFLLMDRNRDTLAKMNDQLTRAVEMFSVGMQGAIENAVRRVEHMAITADERKAIDNIPHADAGYLSVKEVKAGFMAGTRNDTFTTLEAWAGAGYPADDPKPVLLLTAGAGLGKSAVAHQLCVRLADTEKLGLNLGASFFFSRGDVGSAHTFFSTIAYQLALSQPSLKPVILDAARAFLVGGKEQQMRRTFEQLLLKPLAVRSGIAVYQATTFLVIDGLDECKDRDLVPELLRYLLELVRSVPWLRVFLATRPEPYILPVLTSQSAANIVYHRRLDDPQAMNESKESVELYLRQTIPSIHPYGEFVYAHPDQLDRLVDRADGLFMYARVAVNYLEMYDTHPEERLALLLESGGARLSPLDKLYLQVLQSAFPSEDLAEWPALHKRLHHLLTFIALRLGPLPPAAISLLLTLTDDDVLWMAGRLRAVLLLDEYGNLVPLHATLGEFLVDSKRCIDPLYLVDPPKGHALLAHKCLTAFKYDTVTLYLRSRLYSPRDSYASFDSDTMRSWRAYIVEWDSHLTAAGHSDIWENPRRYIPVYSLNTCK
ncbi:AAA-16 domain-containing protein [Phanerochaete sordida]|uniref:AAA-16 domain-containing protein n=1 Tax=Phanerochaete sordida TaxID=48140 RepID=A0A9P3GE10_9APHY|nr:AAA-16 domain-containing protein [Phanerochaete sordida]